MNTKQKIDVMQLYTLGYPLLFKRTTKGVENNAIPRVDCWTLWDNNYGEPKWNWNHFVYRVRTNKKEACKCTCCKCCDCEV